jgi:protease-4
MALGILIGDLCRNVWRSLANAWHRLRRKRMDYVVLRLEGSFPERAPRPRRPFPLAMLPWPAPPLSVESFAGILDLLADDPRVKGAVLVFGGLAAGPATLASLRQAVTRFRGSGKEAIAILHDITMWSYYLACACDRIVAPESAGYRVAGLRAEALFLKDTLALAGIEADFEAIAEYEISPDALRRAEMTEPHREMLGWLLDSLFDEVVRAMSEGRQLAPDEVEQLLDAVPMTAEEARAQGLLDIVCYEDELAARLGVEESLASVIPWSEARKQLNRPRRWRGGRAIGAISLEGVIVPGPSRQPPLPIPVPLPLPTRQAGSDTIVQLLRSAARDKGLAAVVLHVESPGGSALAADLIWREVAHLRRAKPVVVYMGNQATSGGYYASAPANMIVSQPTTITGSIGVWGGKLVTSGLLDKAGAGREAVSRGKAAGLYADSAPFSDDERSRIRADMGATYSRFTARVSEGRGMSEAEVDAIARGRVWTGEQALGHKLVDRLGDFRDAADSARELAGLSPRRTWPVVDISPPTTLQLPQPIATEASGWFTSMEKLLREGVFAVAPWQIRFRG